MTRQAGKPDPTRASPATGHVAFSILHSSFVRDGENENNEECQMAMLHALHEPTIRAPGAHQPRRARRAVSTLYEIAKEQSGVGF